MLAVQFSGKAGDFLAHGRGQGWGGSGAGFPFCLRPVQDPLAFGPDLGVKFGEAWISIIGTQVKLRDSRLYESAIPSPLC